LYNEFDDLLNADSTSRTVTLLNCISSDDRYGKHRQVHMITIDFGVNKGEVVAVVDPCPTEPASSAQTATKSPVPTPAVTVTVSPKPTPVVSVKVSPIPTTFSGES
jgi:hypothetical protein